MKSKKEIWLFISAFGIMFAVLSWLQEAQSFLMQIHWALLKGILQ